ncbi:uncharacterized protein K460DRAFT_139914 [Cucurbitaria berberidis CBS 394.84]|uniref:Uncharacterized protein n=1 Tax=Cucurbitaria berberidis CBS 394.84 TaxID=1168544 RepID=A0A9P4GD36_9PLEO|nr:uncharacterized protein K460DRAFT_139914 [Cucurbitaria berberidis CBS 394.84]KAF1843131.1 hypothetical protein K460DRAFT_139914 [Cucurbitaria berberidis CBS 394.84]
MQIGRVSIGNHCCVCSDVLFMSSWSFLNWLRSSSVWAASWGKWSHSVSRAASLFLNSSMIWAVAFSRISSSEELRPAFLVAGSVLPLFALDGLCDLLEANHPARRSRARARRWSSGTYPVGSISHQISENKSSPSV